MENFFRQLAVESRCQETGISGARGCGEALHHPRSTSCFSPLANIIHRATCARWKFMRIKVRPPLPTRFNYWPSPLLLVRAPNLTPIPSYASSLMPMFQLETANIDPRVNRVHFLFSPLRPGSKKEVFWRAPCFCLAKDIAQCSNPYIVFLIPYYLDI